MLIHTRQHLFGAIQISTRKAVTVHKYLNKYRDTLDGILVWTALLKEKDNGGNIGVRIQNLLAKTQRPLTPQYAGGLLKFVHDLESAWAELETLGLDVDERLRKINLLGHLDRVNSTVTDFLSQQCRDKHDTFDQCVTYLKEYGSRKESVSLSSSRRKANLLSTTDSLESIPDFSSNLDSSLDMNSSDELSSDDLRLINLLSNQGKRDISENPFSIPREAWKLMVKAYGKDISKYIEARKEAERAKKETNADSVSRANSNQPPILRKKQYDSLPADIKALLVEQVHVGEDENVSEEQSDDSGTESSVDNDRKAMTTLTETDRQVLQTLQSLYSPDRHINLTRSDNSTTVINTTSYTKLIFDSGADTSVLGENWSIKEIYGPTINLVGFDSSCSRKKNLRLCTADTILEHPTHGLILIRIHQAVHNPTARNTLLSEYQLSESGCLIDTKPTHHRYPNGSYGTQCFKHPKVSHTWKFDIDACLMTLPHRAPTLEESEVLTPVEITGSSHWCPSDHCQSSNSMDHNRIAFSDNHLETIECNAVMLDGDKSMAIYFDCFEHADDEFHDAVEFGVDYAPCFSSVHFDDSTLPLDEDVFLATLSDLNLDQFPTENLFDVAEYIRHAFNINRTIAPKNAKSQDLNPKAIQPCLGYLPLDVIKRTLDCTTQLAKLPRLYYQLPLY